MATYNFTVRATDNLGAYADQNFSLTVNNTNIERWVIAGATGLAHSSDGVNWTIEAGQSGGRVSYGNGKWVVYGGNTTSTYNGGLGLNIRTSTDAFNWSTVATGIPTSITSTINGSTAQTYTANLIQSLKYQNNVWTAIVTTGSVTGANSYYFNCFAEFTSPDLVTWTQKGVSGGYNNGNTTTGLNVCDHYCDANGMTVIIMNSNGGSYILARTGSATSYTSFAPGTTAITGQLSYINGLYTCAPGMAQNVYTSIDGVGWTARTCTAASTYYPSGFAYANGRLVALPVIGSESAAIPTTYSLNGGRTWLTGGNTNAFGTALGSSTTTVNYSSQRLAYYGGRLIGIEGQLDRCYLMNSTDSGQTWVESQAVGTSIGAGLSIAVRV